MQTLSTITGECKEWRENNSEWIWLRWRWKGVLYMANAVVMKVMMMLKRCPEYDTYEGNAETTNVALHTCDYVPPNDYPRCMKSMPPSLISHMLFCDYPGVSSIYSTSPSSPSSSPPACWGWICDIWIANMSSSPPSQSPNITHQPWIPNTNNGLGVDDNMVLQLWQGRLWNQCMLRNPWTILQVSNSSSPWDIRRSLHRIKFEGLLQKIYCIVTTTIIQLYLVVMYRLLFLGVVLLTQTIGTTSHTHRSNISKSLFIGKQYVHDIKHRTR